MITHHLRQIRLIACAFTLTLMARAEQGSPVANVVQLGDLPSVVQKTILEKTKGATIEQIVESPASYSARLDAGGQKSEVRVTKDGRVLRIRSKHEAEAHFEEEKRLAQAGQLNTVALESIPDAARNVITESAKGLKIDQIVKTPTTYTVRMNQSGKKNEIYVADNGKALDENPR